MATETSRPAAGRAFRMLKVNAATGLVARSVGRRLAGSTEAFIFVASTGRSGTDTLHRIFSLVPGCASFHEPHPAMNRRIQADCNAGDPGPARRAFYRQKLPRIYWNSIGKRIYFEYNHMFIKSFSEFCVEEFGDRLRVIHLRRDPVRVASSLLARGAIPGSPRGDEWLLDHRAPANVLRAADLLEGGGEFRHDFSKCLWYCYEIDARFEAFRARHPAGVTHRIRTEDLSDRERVGELIGQICPPPAGFELPESLGIRANASREPPALPGEISPEAIERFDRLCRQRSA